MYKCISGDFVLYKPLIRGDPYSKEYSLSILVIIPSSMIPVDLFYNAYKQKVKNV